MPLFQKSGSDSAFPGQDNLVEEMKIVAKAHEIYGKLVAGGTVKSIMSKEDGRPELNEAGPVIWEQVAAGLEEAGFQPTEEIRKKFFAELEDKWSLSHIGPDA